MGGEEEEEEEEMEGHCSTGQSPQFAVVPMGEEEEEEEEKKKKWKDIVRQAKAHSLL